jgi:DNA-binding winged helix-turn-helix (wHTH) protein
VPPAVNARLYRFGIYEVDLRSGELRKNGTKLKLQEQPFQVLAMLLEHPGEVLTREQLRQRLWPADTFVDFDHSLNTAINKLRDALGDSAANPRFIETLAKRGYRFIAPVAPPLSLPGEPALSAVEGERQGGGFQKCVPTLTHNYLPVPAATGLASSVNCRSGCIVNDKTAPTRITPMDTLNGSVQFPVRWIR